MPEPPGDAITLGTELAWDLLDRMELCGEDGDGKDNGGPGQLP